MHNPSASTLLSIREVSKSFGKNSVLQRVSLEVAEGEFLTVLGESGSGKTTLLRLVAGFEQLDSGEIWMAGGRLDTLAPYRRRVNTVFQQYALFPHLNVFDNVAYGLRAESVDTSEVTQRVDAALAMVKMADKARSLPSKISGGQQQRVALARALVKRPRLLLLDEPLSALDANLRRQMQLELKALQREVGITFIFVTHDQEEAMALSDRIALLRSGELEQVDTPAQIYDHPRTAYSARFIGQTNLLQGEVSGGRARVGSWQWPCVAKDGATAFSLRPEKIRIADPSRNGAVRFAARVREQIFQGATRIVGLEVAPDLMLTARIPAEVDPSSSSEFEFDAADAVPIESDRGEKS